MPAHALNLNFKDDAVERVRENRRRFLAAAGQDWPIITAKQTHSTAVRVFRDRADDAGKEPEADVVVTAETEVFAGVKTADCLSILIADPGHNAVAAVHAGWRGTALGVAAEAVRALERLFGTDPATCLAALGPAACGACYEVGDDVAAEFRRVDLGSGTILKTGPTAGKFLLDVPEANRVSLFRLGFAPERVFSAPYCTMHQNDLFFSHRRESPAGAPVGRLLSIIGVAKGKST
jgi:YfiH family protein